MSTNGNEGNNNVPQPPLPIAGPPTGAMLPIAGPPAPSGTSSQPRQPRSLQDVLRYAIEAGGGSMTADAPGDSRPVPLDAERREFISNALRSLTVDTTKELMEAIEILKNLDHYDENPTEYEEALCKIANHVDRMDDANDFIKLGGFDVALSCLNSRHCEIRWRMADIIGQCAQNNPFCQLEAVRLGFIPLFLKLAVSDRDEKCRIKAFFAVSNIVRACEPALQEFIKLDGFSVVLRLMESESDKLQNKATFFLSSILSGNPKLVGELANKGFIEELIKMIKKEHSFLHEHIISALLTIVKNSTVAENECRRAELTLLPTLTKILNDFGHDDAFREEISDIRDLILLVFPEDPDVER